MHTARLASDDDAPPTSTLCAPADLNLTGTMQRPKGPKAACCLCNGSRPPDVELRCCHLAIHSSCWILYQDELLQRKQPARCPECGAESHRWADESTVNTGGSCSGDPPSDPPSGRTAKCSTRGCRSISEGSYGSHEWSQFYYCHMCWGEFRQTI